MLKKTIGVAATLLFLGAPMAHAQQSGAARPAMMPEHGRLSPTELTILTDVRIGIVRAALQLTPEQQQHWPAVENAIRARAETRYRHLLAARDRIGQWRELDIVQFYRERAEALSGRAAALERLAQAWQPLYLTLTAEQKLRLRFVTVRALDAARTAIESRQAEIYDEDDSEF